MKVDVVKYCKMRFDKGLCCYVGSAQNKIIDEIARPKRKTKKIAGFGCSDCRYSIDRHSVDMVFIQNQQA